MPEGDTIHRAARTLHEALAGQEVRGFRSPLPQLRGVDLVGSVVSSVGARGKHLLVRFDDGRVLHTHMRMKGSWHVYRPGERFRKSDAAVRVVLETEPWVAVCFMAPVVELLDHEGRSPALRRLGPDLLDPGFDREEALRRLRAEPGRPLGEAVMLQRAVSGVGNVYKSEVLFLSRLDPFAPVGSVDQETLGGLLARARKLLAHNLRGGPRVTRRRAGGRLWVYDRSGEPCFECGARVQMRRQGDLGRSTYFCPACQGVTG